MARDRYWLKWLRCACAVLAVCAERLAQVYSGTVSRCGILGECTVDDLTQIARYGRVVPLDRRRRIHHVLSGNVGCALTGKGALATQHLIEHDPNRVYIGGRCQCLASDEFWRSIVRCAPQFATLFRCAGREGTGNAEIGDFCFAVRLNKNILWLDVAVNDALIVYKTDGIADL